VKVRLLLIFLFLGFTEVSFAQVLIGPSVGINYSWTTFDDKDNKALYKVTPVIGYHAGFNFSFRVRKRFFLHSSLIYSTKGKLVEGRPNSDPDLRNKVVYKYIELPILYTVEFKMKAKDNREFKVYLGAGPNLSYWLGGRGTFYNGEIGEEIYEGERKYKIAFGKNFEETDKSHMGVKEANRLQLGLNLSAGFVFEPIQHQEFMLTFRYELGHSFLSRTSDGTFGNILTYQDDLQTRNQGFRISLAYLIDLKTDQRKRGKSTSTIGKKRQ
jgi:hypothetical protein